MASGLFRLAAGLGRNVVVATTCATLALPVVMVLGGFIVARGNFHVQFQYGLRNIMRPTTFLICMEKIIHSFFVRGCTPVVAVGILDLTNDVWTECYRCE